MIETLAPDQVVKQRQVQRRADELVAKLDAAAGTNVFSERIDEQLKARPFPDYEAMYERLGIRILGGHPIFVDAPAARYRNAIMLPPVADTNRYAGCENTNVAESNRKD